MFRKSLVFKNSDVKTNGELALYNSLRNKLDIIFDVGCRNDSIFTNFKGDVHYFDPNPAHLAALSKQANDNNNAHFNGFGLSDVSGQMHYYPKYESFHNRIKTLGIDDSKNKVLFMVRKASDYIQDNDIKTIDFLKIDTEGHEYNVLVGFGDYIKQVKYIQFEYGGTFADSGVKLADVIRYLGKYGFVNFAYLTRNGSVLIKNCKDHYQYCNIVCQNSLFSS